MLADINFKFWQAALIARVATFSSPDKLFQGHALKEMIRDENFMKDTLSTVVVSLAAQHYLFMLEIIARKVGQSAGIKAREMARQNNPDNEFSFMDVFLFYGVCIGLMIAIAVA